MELAGIGGVSVGFGALIAVRSGVVAWLCRRPTSTAGVARPTEAFRDQCLGRGGITQRDSAPYGRLWRGPNPGRRSRAEPLGGTK